MGIQTSGDSNMSLLNMLQSAADERQAPVGVVVRQAATARQMESLSSLFGQRPLDDSGLFGESFEDLLHRLMMTEQSSMGAPPASEACLAHLPRTRFTASQLPGALTSCGIGHDPFEEGDLTISLTCGHAYREEAIVTWLKRHNTCPVCRLPVEETAGESS